jgi:4-hydroxy-tetrahydrodipicolinate reductase
VVGSRGRVGSRIVWGIDAADDLELVGSVDLGDDLVRVIETCKPEVAVEFTVPGAVFQNTCLLLEWGVHTVVGTTGLTDDQLTKLDAVARKRRVGCLVAPNFALGAVLMMRFAEEAARHFPWVEVVERHHEQKLDAPSGTARETAARIAAARGAEQTPSGPEGETESAPGARGGRVSDVPVHSLRLPGSMAHQEVWFGGPGETLVIRHDAIDREVFVPGVLLAVRRIRERIGLLRGLGSLIWTTG